MLTEKEKQTFIELIRRPRHQILTANSKPLVAKVLTVLCCDNVFLERFFGKMKYSKIERSLAIKRKALLARLMADDSVTWKNHIALIIDQLSNTAHTSTASTHQDDRYASSSSQQNFFTAANTQNVMSNDATVLHNPRKPALQSPLSELKLVEITADYAGELRDRLDEIRSNLDRTWDYARRWSMAETWVRSNVLKQLNLSSMPAPFLALIAEELYNRRKDIGLFPDKLLLPNLMDNSIDFITAGCKKIANDRDQITKLLNCISEVLCTVVNNQNQRKVSVAEKVGMKNLEKACMEHTKKIEACAQQRMQQRIRLEQAEAQQEIARVELEKEQAILAQIRAETALQNAARQTVLAQQLSAKKTLPDPNKLTEEVEEWQKTCNTLAMETSFIQLENNRKALLEKYKPEIAELGAREIISKIFDAYCCPVSKMVPRTPVRLPGDKNVYDLDSLKKWYQALADQNKLQKDMQTGKIYAINPSTRTQFTLSEVHYAGGLTFLIVGSANLDLWEKKLAQMRLKKAAAKQQMATENSADVKTTSALGTAFFTPSHSKASESTSQNNQHTAMEFEATSLAK
jgi:hypothetical protein